MDEVKGLIESLNIKMEKETIKDLFDVSAMVFFPQY